LFAVEIETNGDLNEDIVICNNHTPTLDTTSAFPPVDAGTGQQQQELEPELCLLWPQPRFLQQVDGVAVEVPAHLLLVVNASGSAHQVLDLWQQYREELAACGHTASVKVF
jgi:hypothetical protein